MLVTGFETGRLPGGAGLLAGEANGFGADFKYDVDPAKRVAVKVAGVVTEYAADAFITSAGTSPKQVFNSAGVLSWAPHNMFLNSGVPATQVVNLTVGATYTMSVVGSGSLAGSVGASGTATEGSPATFVATGISCTFTKTGTLTTMQLNRGSVPTAYLATAGSIRNGLAFDHNPVAPFAPRGVLVEPSATNLLLNNATLSTQSVTVSATGYVLSFWGTGTVTLSGTSTAGPLVGTGVNDRVTLAFTPTAGSLTLTVSGTVSRAQLEAGTVATSPISTFAASATRAADTVTFLLSTIPALGAEYSMYAQFSTPIINNTRYPLALTDGTTNEFAALRINTTVTCLINDGGVLQGSMVVGSAVTANVPVKAAMRVKANDLALSAAGVAPTVDTAGTVPTPTIVNMSGGLGTAQSFAAFHIQQVAIVPRGWNNAELQGKTA
jgi:hypothetical protein